VGASSESKAVGIEELRVKAKKLYKEVSCSALCAVFIDTEMVRLS
jgi:activator of 2-hydroxyglutaryl-CoA dehydratase